jgi:hypothetical protein
MATFPALKPISRTLSLGDYPQTIYQAISGVNVRFLRNTKRVDQRLNLGYEYLTETEVQLIYDHYAIQEGTLIPFDLPSEVWAGYTTVPIDVVDYEWRYANSFSVDSSSSLNYNLQIELIASVV